MSAKPSYNQKGKKSAKRKHLKESPEERYRNERLDSYNKLHHTSSKLLHKEGKIVKSFECQKIVRAIKASNETLAQIEESSRDEKGFDKAKTKVALLEEKLERTKKLDLNMLVSLGLKRLGMLSFDPNSDLPTEDTSNAQTPSPDQDSFYISLIETMLRHKRLSTVMDQINEKIIDYRSWMARQEEMLFDDKSEPKSKKKKKKQNPSSRDQNETLIVAGSTKQRKIDLGGHEGTSGLFIGSLSGQNVDVFGDADDEEYNSHDDEELYEKKKKNRPGQRARKAKAMAIEAKKAGRTWDSSINWREKKETTEQELSDDRGRRHNGASSRTKKTSNNNNDRATKAKVQDIATMGKSWKEDGNAHPSWAAAAAQKSQGIVEFKGTKITF